METVVVEAVYENGVLRPLQPLDLQEHQTVRVQVLPLEIDAEATRIIQRLVDAGLILPRPVEAPPPDPVTEDERLVIAERLGRARGKPLSEIVLEDRGGL